MQFSNIVAVLSLAMAAAAAPAPAPGSMLVARTGGTQPECENQGSKNVCLLGGLLGIIQNVGAHCGSSAKCCETNAVAGGIINIIALNCVDISLL